MQKHKALEILNSDRSYADKIDWLLSESALGRVGYLECLARIADRCVAYCSITDPRLTCIAAALRSNSVGEQSIRDAKYAMDKSWIDYDDSNLENCADKLKYAFAASAIWSAANESEDAAFNSKHAGNKELELITQLADIREILNK